VTYKGYINKDSRKQYLKEYMRGYRVRQKLDDPVLRFIQALPSDFNLWLNQLLISKDLNIELDSLLTLHKKLEIEIQENNRNYEEHEKTLDPESIKFLVTANNLRKSQILVGMKIQVLMFIQKMAIKQEVSIKNVRTK